jgi:hypothetical protein
MASPGMPPMLGRLRGATDARRVAARRQSLATHRHLPLVFDGAWYLARYPDVLGAGVEPLAHLLGSGLAEGRDPSPYVDLSFVATMVPELGGDRVALFAHLLDSGLAAGVPTSPYVDLRWYAERHARPHPGTDPLATFRDLVTHGRAEQLDPSPFVDLRWYAQHHRDVTLGGVDPFEYLLSVGQMLGRFPHPLWDEQAYIAGNEYVRFAVGVGKYRTGFEHFCATGHTEVARGAVALPVRIDGVLDELSEERYLAANPDVRDAVGSGAVANGVTHLFAGGHLEVADGTRPLKLPGPIATATSGPGDATSQGDWLVVLVHFDVDRVVDPHVLAAVDTYRAAGADVCVVTVELDDAALAPLRQRAMMIVRKSTNDDLRDFGGWHLALEALGPDTLARYSQVVLANDSVYFPVLDPAPFLEAMRATEADVFAATDSLSGGRYHLQSYLLALRPRAVEQLAPEIARRIAEQAGATKLSLIQRFEVGLTQFALEHGLTTAAYCSVADLDDVAGSLNPPDPRDLSHLAVTVTNLTHHFWRHTLVTGLPMLKVELLRDNPLDVAIDGWHQLVDGGSCTAVMIEGHLARVRRDATADRR